MCYPDKVQPACLPAFNQRLSHGTNCWTSGFGTTEAGSGKLECHNKYRETIDEISIRVPFTRSKGMITFHNKNVARPDKHIQSAMAVSRNQQEVAAPRLCKLRLAIMTFADH